METHAVPESTPHAKSHAKPNYMLVWLILFVLTVAEVVVAFVSNLPDVILIVALLGLALWKAVLVALYYMHLKFEPPRLWVLVVTPLPLVVILIGAVLLESW